MFGWEIQEVVTFGVASQGGVQQAAAAGMCFGRETETEKGWRGAAAR